MARCLMIVAFAPIFILGPGAAARAQGEAAANQPADAQAQPADTQATAKSDEAPAGQTAASKPPSNAAQFGVAFQSRFISLPSAFLKAFTKANRPLSSYGIGVEGFRRKRDTDNPNRFWEISLGLSYQNMSPSDGTWLGNRHDASVDTDWVQFKKPGLFTDFAFWTVDFSLVERQYFNDFFGIHYGAGLGLTIVQGEILRTKAIGPWDPAANGGTGGYDIPCTDQNISQCRPIVCTGGVCTEAELSKTQNGKTPSVGDPHRFREPQVWPALPALTLLTGVDFRIPQVKGLEFRIDAGFFDLFVIFVGGGVAYVFP